MAVEVEIEREAVRVELAARSLTQTRLHEEVLPPKLDGSSPRALRNARRALAILAVVVVLLQPLSLPVGRWLNSVARSGTDAYSLWQRYASSPVPDVLVIGASPTYADIDEAGLASALSLSAGRTVTVEKLGFNGQGPVFYDALMYRILKRPQHPSLIVVTTAPPDLNDGCTSCSATLTTNLWDISDPLDPEFDRLALSLDPEPARLATGWVLPSYAYYPSIVALQCLAVNGARAATVSIRGRVPAQLQDPTICETQPGYFLVTGWMRQPEMTEGNVYISTKNYTRFMADYHISPRAVSSFFHAVATARNAGVSVVLLQPPLHSGARTLFPEAERAYQDQIQAIAAGLNVPLVNLSESIPDDPRLWVDLLHLDRAGAAYFAPTLADALAPALGG
jgi:hypothetical protein